MNTPQTLIAIAICGITMILLISTLREVFKARKANRAPIVVFSYDEKKSEPASLDDSMYIDLYGFPFKVRSEVKMIECAGMLKTFIFKNDMDMKYIVRLLKKDEKALLISFQSAKVYFAVYDYIDRKWMVEILNETLDIKALYSNSLTQRKYHRRKRVETIKANNDNLIGSIGSHITSVDPEQ